MGFFPWFPDDPKLRFFGDSARNRLIRQSAKEASRHWEWWVAVGAIFLSTIPIWLGALSLVFDLPHVSQGIEHCIAYCAAIYIPNFFVALMLCLCFRRYYFQKAILRHYDGRPPSCFACGYDLRYCENFDQSGCPECGWLPTSATSGAMDRKATTTWFLIGIYTGVAALLGPAFAVFLLVNPVQRDNPYGGVKPNTSLVVQGTGRPSSWFSTQMALGNSGFTASAGPGRYRDENDQEWDFYAIEIQKPEGGVSYVFFERRLRMSEVPAELVDKTVNDIVSFDEESGVVTFTLGSDTHTCTLASREWPAGEYGRQAAPNSRFKR